MTLASPWWVGANAFSYSDLFSIQLTFSQEKSVTEAVGLTHPTSNRASAIPVSSPAVWALRPEDEASRSKTGDQTAGNMPVAEVGFSAANEPKPSPNTTGRNRMAKGTHDYVQDPRNNSVLINVNGELFPREKAVVSVFDSGFIMGDGVWEGLRLHHGKIAFADAHMDRLFEGAKTLDMDIGLTRETLMQRIYDTVSANEMTDGVHIRLMVSRGVKATPYQDPRVAVSPPTVVIIPEYKSVLPDTLEKGIRLFTTHVRRAYPDTQDPKLNTHSKHNCIMACIQAAKAGYDEGLMLDPHGFVATCNSTHFFIVRGGEVWTSTGDYCLRGITRQQVINVCNAHGIPCHEKRFSLTDVYGADEAFVTGTFAGLIHATEVDGRILNGGKRGPLVQRLQSLYADWIENDCQGS